LELTTLKPPLSYPVPLRTGVLLPHPLPLLLVRMDSELPVALEEDGQLEEEEELELEDLTVEDKVVSEEDETVTVHGKEESTCLVLKTLASRRISSVKPETVTLKELVSTSTPTPTSPSKPPVPTSLNLSPNSCLLSTLTSSRTSPSLATRLPLPFKSTQFPSSTVAVI